MQAYKDYTRKYFDAKKQRINDEYQALNFTQERSNRPKSILINTSNKYMHDKINDLRVFEKMSKSEIQTEVRS